MRAFTVGARGSSPRGRGKRSWRPRRAWCGRLIPARAGKTLLATPQANLGRAHPRAGGENAQGHILTRSFEGSSPRGRGKHTLVRLSSLVAGLIPARAGKTLPSQHPGRAATAHPRAGGENRDVMIIPSRRWGSSPRGRGKPLPSRAVSALGWLIPARAGKTARLMFSALGVWAHPRAGGENAGRQLAGLARQRLIPARAGKTL